MNLDLTGKNALVCGSSQGLGLASAIEIALLGANVVLMARDEEKIKKAIEKLDTSKGQKHSYLVADFSDAQSVRKSINQYISSGEIIHILINNTGDLQEAKPLMQILISICWLSISILSAIIF